jgi:hypothetical protein
MTSLEPHHPGFCKLKQTGLPEHSRVMARSQTLMRAGGRITFTLSKGVSSDEQPEENPDGGR